MRPIDCIPTRRTALAAIIAVSAWPLFAAKAEQAGSTDAAWAALAGDGAVALVRHAKAPGPSPDPPGVSLADCATQREWRGPGTLVLVTHGVTSRRVAASAGDPGVVVVKPDLILARGYVIVGTIPPPEER